ncbi:hypothetical protein LF599_07455 [Pseudodesulfovibrio thermohalotolerans]|uniref:hypothetical protein n=1 Tax=Pseudodesulfovibrio thermohalotolerans TaxID=2880651 RepID=UPI002442B3D2|nr:hypothetical protein [Pseudodesulfovibrio thermohalotolerans]WFS63991.1 hypothetical protein LF599_07455 [Pseudodesulfovibrio thermohalotolerans]
MRNEINGTEIIAEELVKAIVEKINHEPGDRAYAGNNYGQIHFHEQYLYFNLADGTVELLSAPQGCVPGNCDEHFHVACVNDPVIESDLDEIDSEDLEEMKEAWADDRDGKARDIAWRIGKEVCEYALCNNECWDAESITEIAPDFDSLDPASPTFVDDAAAMINAAVEFRHELANTAENIGGLVEDWINDKIDD